MKKIISILIGISLYTSSCQPDAWWPQGEGFSELDSIRLNQLLQKKVFIMNEGLFNFNNASLSIYDEASKALELDYYRNITQQAMGDIGQSMLLKDSLLFCVINNSGKLVALDLKNNAFVNEYIGLTSPRFAYWTSDNSLLISDLYANEITKIDPLTFQFKTTVALPGWTEHFLPTSKGVWIERRPIFSNPGLKFGLFLFNEAFDAFSDSLIFDSSEPSGIVAIEEKIWILYSGSTNSTPKLVAIDLEHELSYKISTYYFGVVNGSASNLAYDIKMNRLVFDYEGISSFSLSKNEFHLSNITTTQIDWYNIAVNPKNGEIYATDPAQFTSVGKVYRYASNGELLDVFETGLIPSEILFTP